MPSRRSGASAIACDPKTERRSMTLIAPASQADSDATDTATGKQNRTGQPSATASSRATPPRRFWLGATPPHALVETLLVAAAVSVLAYLLIYNPSRFGPGR